MKFFFRNDYSFGAHPKVLEAVSQTNLEGNIGYGEDDHTKAAKALILDRCQCPQGHVEFFVGGTQVNAVAIAAFLRPWEGVISAESAHINGHEAGAVESTGHKILQIPTDLNGKLTPDLIAPLLEKHKDVHLVLPRMVEIANATESGMIYTKSELTELSQYCRANDLLLFLDGARLGAALTAQQNDLTLADLAALTDAFTIGGTKNGALFGEALVITNETLMPHFFRIKKQMGAVLAKGWLQGAQFKALFEDDLYFEMAKQGNETAARLQAGLVAKGWTLWVTTPTNQVFAVVDNTTLPKLDALCHYEVWQPYDATHSVVRFVTCFHTTAQYVDDFLSALD